MDTRQKLKGLLLSASELKDLTGWPDPVIEDHLDTTNNTIILATEIDRRSGILKNTVLVNPVSYLLSANDQIIFCNTDLGNIQIILPEGANGTDYRVINAGTSGNTVEIVSEIGESIFSELSQVLYDKEVLDVVFNEFEGWS